LTGGYKNYTGLAFTVNTSKMNRNYGIFSRINEEKTDSKENETREFCLNYTD
jgi:hypothetical protein